MSAMHCPSCGFEVDDQFKFCTSCGAVLQTGEGDTPTEAKGEQAQMAGEVSAEAVGEQAQMADEVSAEAESEQALPVDEASTEAVGEQALPIARDGIEPMFTFKYGRAEKPREIRLYEKHVTWHESAYSQVSVIPYRSIHYLECAELDEGEHVVFMRVANPDINFAISGPPADIAAITERLTSLIC